MTPPKGLLFLSDPSPPLRKASLSCCGLSSGCFAPLYPLAIRISQALLCYLRVESTRFSPSSIRSPFLRRLAFSSSRMMSRYFSDAIVLPRYTATLEGPASPLLEFSPLRDFFPLPDNRYASFFSSLALPSSLDSEFRFFMEMIVALPFHTVARFLEAFDFVGEDFDIWIVVSAITGRKFKRCFLPFEISLFPPFLLRYFPGVSPIFCRALLLGGPTPFFLICIHPPPFPKKISTSEDRILFFLFIRETSPL